MKQALVLLLPIGQALEGYLVKLLQILRRKQAEQLRDVFGMIDLNKLRASGQMPG